MGIKDSIANLRKALRTTQTNAPAVIDTLIRGLDGVETAAEEENTYSDEERIIGKWIDESTLYEKTYLTEALPNTAGAYKQIPTGVTDIDKIIYMGGCVRLADGSQCLPLPFSSSTAPIQVTASKTVIYISPASDRSAYSGEITIRYTKASASRTPENDTKNDGDEEKKDNER